MAKDEPLFKRSQQALGSQKSGRFGAAALNLTPSGTEGSDALAAVAAAEEPDPTIRARLRGALAAGANGVQSIQVWDPVAPARQRWRWRWCQCGAEGELSTASPQSPSVYHCASVCTTMYAPTPNQVLGTNTPMLSDLPNIILITDDKTDPGDLQVLGSGRQQFGAARADAGPRR